MMERGLMCDLGCGYFF
jgi:hypothetical protein